MLLPTFELIKIFNFFSWKLNMDKMLILHKKTDTFILMIQSVINYRRLRFYITRKSGNLHISIYHDSLFESICITYDFCEKNLEHSDKEFQSRCFFNDRIRKWMRLSTRSAWLANLAGLECSEPKLSLPTNDKNSIRADAACFSIVGRSVLSLLRAK